MKLALTAVEHVQNVQLVMIKFKIKVKMILTVEDHVKRVQLVTMVLRIKGKQALIAEAHVIHSAKVLRTCCNDIRIVRRFKLISVIQTRFAYLSFHSVS